MSQEERVWTQRRGSEEYEGLGDRRLINRGEGGFFLSIHSGVYLVGVEGDLTPSS